MQITDRVREILTKVRPHIEANPEAFSLPNPSACFLATYIKSVLRDNSQARWCDIEEQYTNGENFIHLSLFNMIFNPDKVDFTYEELAEFSSENVTTEGALFVLDETLKTGQISEHTWYLVMQDHDYYDDSDWEDV